MENDQKYKEPIFKLIINEIFPLALQRVCNKIGKKYDSTLPLFDFVTIKCIKELYSNYMELLLSCKTLEELGHLLIIERVSDFEYLDSYHDLNSMLAMINNIKKLEITEKTFGLNLIMIKWGFLPIIEDILYSKACELPITMPSYFHSFNMVYNNKLVWDAMNKKSNEENFEFFDEDPIEISVYKKDLLGTRTILFKNDFLIEGSTLEGMYVYAFLHNKKYKKLFGTIEFFLDKEKIRVNEYVKLKKSLFAEKYEGILPLYTAMIEPGFEIVNYSQPMFVEGFNALDEIIGGLMIIRQDNIIVNSEKANFIKT